MNTALLLAGGTGTRTGLDIPKQYVQVNGRPVISWCLERLEQHEEIDRILIAADKDWHDRIRDYTGPKFYGFSQPGANRQLSIFHGLQAIARYAGAEELVLIHDAARPFVTAEQISDCLHAARGHEGAVPVLPMKDTVYYSEDGKTITSLLKRECLVAGQAPECFVFGKYYEANLRLLPDDILGINGSAEPAVMAGMDIVTIKGDEKNSKLTTEEDMIRFREIAARFALREKKDQGSKGGEKQQ